MDQRAKEAAHQLWTCRESGGVIDTLPEALRPQEAHPRRAVTPAP